MGAINGSWASLAGQLSPLRHFSADTTLATDPFPLRSLEPKYIQTPRRAPRDSPRSSLPVGIADRVLHPNHSACGHRNKKRSLKFQTLNHKHGDAAASPRAHV